VLDGEMQVSVKKAQAKNVGKSNETSAIQQAEIEAEALYVFKRDRKYFETKEEAEKGVVILPMLAKEIDKKKIIYPCLVQPKLDGVRCLAYWENDKIKLLSRGGKEWTVPNHINFQLESLLPKDCMFDGELYVHGKNFDTITTYVNKRRT
jgi:ATP-dependent DNA ligase